MSKLTITITFLEQVNSQLVFPVGFSLSSSHILLHILFRISKRLNDAHFSYSGCRLLRVFI